MHQDQLLSEKICDMAEFKHGVADKPIRPELWGGIECTINRVRDTFMDQLHAAGHYDRDADIDLIAGLGIKRLRFPILWEKHEPVANAAIDWSWTDKRMKQLRDHSIQPIAGLVHHGSGPAFTDMSRRSFATGLAAYAGKVAQRYPWLQYYTPVNEPLTTARFSGLYGFWYPHGSSDAAFCKMLLNELKATVLAMQEIRKINPAASLIQTEDLGKTYSVPELQYQADFENDRRWISFDFLCGKVDKDHPLWDFFIRAGISERSLLFFRENPCPPSVLGLNYYVTSERFLDNRLSDYPPHMHGGNWLESYVDTEAVRVNHGQPSGLGSLLKEVEDRYHLPMAVTESHLNCTMEERMRWFQETWDICCKLKDDGSPIEAVTAWSLFGAYGWNKLLTSPGGDYEPGVFDLRGGTPRPTAMVNLLKSAAGHSIPSHPVLSQKGWWHRRDRFHQSPPFADAPSFDNPAKASPLLLVGAGSELMDCYSRICYSRSIHHQRLSPDGDVSSVNAGLTKAWGAIIIAGDDEEVDAIARLAWPKELQQMIVIRAGAKLTVSPAFSDALIVSHGMLLHATLQNEYHKDRLEEIVKAAEVGSITDLTDLVQLSLDLLIDGEKGHWSLIHDECPLMTTRSAALSKFKEGISTFFESDVYS